MAGGLNKKKALRSARNKKAGRDKAKRAQTRRNKMRILKRHILIHAEDQSARKALDRWDKNPPNKAF